MIFYFSGTGNSFDVAKDIAKHNNEELISIASLINSGKTEFEYILKDNETIGFVYPVYAWAPPKIVLQFIEKLKINNYKDNYIFSVATCGANIGNTMKAMSFALQKRNLELHSGFSLIMPNNYIIMGDVDSKEVEDKKLSEAKETLKYINGAIDKREKGIFKLVKGVMPGLLTSVINPLFSNGSNKTKKFYAKDNCISCGICESVCNSKTIKVNGKPTWGEDCTQCLACLHLCPVQAIQYGKGTENKGRYKNPNVTIDEMKINK
ncbi:EFR1 family ferrodoxin [Clostridium algidicarnis]|uniref:Flavodoxin-like protein n=2 Tax=Clostridium algidicarnis TaxID=37659 RepID=A0A2S6G0R5_9CLOT|nr:EFR1 family ferrodoxin [Clostridium algidicarnis]MBB6630771.1 4Fe-4S ferredoxin [Clostridium algidicarnis]MBU3220276.1 EFR1 family ferrodoxin [Clostridium algidicarnis]PPK49390.1 flavodoxin-like protein [Clostridium algidicarnis DSM 15099]